jgi:hypothetical protein
LEIHPDSFYLKMWFADAPSKEYSQGRKIRRANLLGFVWRDAEGCHWAGLRFRYYNEEATGLHDPDHPDTYSYHCLKEKEPGSSNVAALLLLFDRLFELAARFHRSFTHSWECGCTGEELVSRITEGVVPDLTFLGKLTPDEMRDFALKVNQGKEITGPEDLFGGQQ